MNKKIKRLLCCGLSACMLFASACAPKSAEKDASTNASTSPKTAMGRYIEKIVEIPAGDTPPSIVVSSDGSLQLFTIKDGTVVQYTSSDNKTWTQINEDWQDKIAKSEKGICELVQVLALKDGSRYALYRDKDYVSRIVKSTDGKTIVEIPMQDWDKKDESGITPYPQSFDVLENGDILVGMYQGVWHYKGTDGTLIKKYEGIGFSFAVANGKLMRPNKECNAIVINDLQSGDSLQEVPYEGIQMQETMLAADEQGVLYLADKKGIHRLAAGGSMWETIVDGELTSLGMPSVGVSSFMLDKKGGYYIKLASESAYKLMHYTYSADTPSIPATELSVYSLKDNETVRQAIGEFQRANPEVKVNFRFGISEDSTESKSDIIRTLNTELLAGKGSDILLLDDLPLESYIEKGVLLDMNTTLAPMIDSGELLSNIANNYTQGGKIFVMPTRFNIPAMFGDKALLSSVKTLKDLANTAQTSGDANLLMGNTPKGRVAEFYLTSLTKWRNEDGSIKQDLFADFLNDVKRIGDVCGDAAYTPDERLISMGNAISNDELGFVDGNFGSLQRLFAGTVKIHIQMLRGFNDLMLPIGGIDKQTNGDIAPLCGQSSTVFVPHGLVGINSATKQQELAIKFIQTLLSQSVQDTDLYDGFPINANSWEKGVKTVKDSMIGVSSSEYNIEISASWPSEARLRAVSDLAKTLTTPATVDTVLLEMIQNECDAFFAGEKTAEQTASAVAERTQAYLTE